MKIMKFLLIGTTAIILLGVLIIRTDRGYVPLPIWFRHIMNSVLISNDNLYRPIAIDSCELLSQNAGYFKTYDLQPKYLDIYEIGLVDNKDGIPANYKFNGKIKISFYYHSDLVLERLVDKIDQAWYKEGSSNYKQIVLCKFNIPLEGRYVDGISVKISIIQPDSQLKKYCEATKLYIGVSPTP